jgi:uncharacterized protein YbbK (DUF523 family)/uncharacterized protein YbgA (DUF1722 family)
MQKIKIGISSCLLGNAVRYDGGHKLERQLTDRLRRYVDFVPVCPEVQSGMGIPREPMNLEGESKSPRLIAHESRRDKTAILSRWLKKEFPRLGDENLCGFIFKSGSPSCGMEKVDIYDKKGNPAKKGAGLFARAFMSCFPKLPAADERRVQNPLELDNFMEMAVVLKCWREARSAEQLPEAWKEFHLCHRLLISAHSPTLCREMERLIPDPERKATGVQALVRQYDELLFRALKLKTTPAKNAYALCRAGACLKKHTSPAENKKFARAVDDYRQGLTSLNACFALADRYAKKYDCAFLQKQVYLNAHPGIGKLLHDKAPNT